MKADGIHATIIDPDIDPEKGDDDFIRQYADRKTLKECDIEHKAGVVACTDNDADNLSILLNARALNPDIFLIARQNDHANQLGFDAASADLTLQASLTSARRILKHLISPLAQELVEHLRARESGQTVPVIERLQAVIGDRSPHLWQVVIRHEETRAAMELLDSGRSFTLGDLVRDPRRTDRFLPCMPLAVRRGGERIMLPADSERVRAGDEILFCGTEGSEWLIAATLNNPYTLHYLATGIDLPRSHVFAWLRKRAGKAA